MMCFLIEASRAFEPIARFAVAAFPAVVSVTPATSRAAVHVAASDVSARPSSAVSSSSSSSSFSSSNQQARVEDVDRAAAAPVDAEATRLRQLSEVMPTSPAAPYTAEDLASAAVDAAALPDWPLLRRAIAAYGCYVL